MYLGSISPMHSKQLNQCLKRNSNTQHWRGTQGFTRISGNQYLWAVSLAGAGAVFMVLGVRCWRICVFLGNVTVFHVCMTSWCVSDRLWSDTWQVQPTVVGLATQHTRGGSTDTQIPVADIVWSGLTLGGKSVGNCYVTSAYRPFKWTSWTGKNVQMKRNTLLI